jgi:hypothetical protein
VNARKRFVEQGLEAALGRKQQDRPSRPRKLDGRAEARLLALACAPPPEGREEWTMQLLADRLVELQVVDAVCDETVRRALKKRDPTVAEGAIVYLKISPSQLRMSPERCRLAEIDFS